jgi:phosphatidylglycerophosphate synthase
MIANCRPPTRVHASPGERCADTVESAVTAGGRAAGRHHASSYPISRWYLRPAAAALAAALAPTCVRPNWLTLCGLSAAGAAAAMLCVRPDAAPWAAGLVLLAWFCDRTDGQLARLQHSASAWGAWLDANVDELADLGLHVSVAAAAAAKTASPLPWALLIAFLAGKYLLMYGLGCEERNAGAANSEYSTANSKSRSPNAELLRKLYHLPGNADVRVHLLLAALCTGWLTAELALVALYYNVRWIARYVLVARRLGGVA